MESIKKEPKVSVLVPCYNEEKFIGHTLESILSQKLDYGYEIIVGDDCSKDGTAEVIREYARKNPEVIIPVIRDANLGMTGNGLDLIKRARGEYIAFVEGDDYWIDDNKLKKQCDFLDSHPDYAACFGFCIIVDENDVRHEDLEKYSGFLKRSGDYSAADFEDYLLPGQTATSMYRRANYDDMLNKLLMSGFDMSKFIDRHLVLMMMASGKLYNSGETTAAYRYVMNKTSESWSSKNDYYAFTTLMNYLGGLKELENMATNLGMKIDFDKRRKYEYDKLLGNLSAFSKDDISVIKKTLTNDSNNMIGMWIYRLKGRFQCQKNIK